jgi:glycosyltransferase involved in cell wall biosynthesis
MNEMRIAIDARYLNGEYSGIAEYSENFLSHLARQDQKNEYVVYIHPNYKKPLPLGENFQVKTYDARPVSLRTVFQFGSVINRERPDLLHSLAPLTPYFYRGPLLVTMYDLQALLVPEFTGQRPWIVRKLYDWFYWWTYPTTVRRARYMITVSEATRLDIARVFPRHADRSIVVHSGIDADQLAACSEELIERTREEFDLPERYLLYIGSTRPNKNLPNMLRGFARAIREYDGLDDLSLVLVVSPDRFFADCRKMIQTLKIGERVQIHRRITEEQKKAFYHAGDTLYLVTKFEGFGLPLLEAQACGMPVLAANHSALPEIGGRSALFVDPDRPDMIAEGLHRIMTDKALREELVQRGRENVKRFSWEKAVQTILQVYNHLF